MISQHISLQADNSDWSGSQYSWMGVAMGSSKGVRACMIRAHLPLHFTVQHAPKADAVIHVICAKWLSGCTVCLHSFERFHQCCWAVTLS